MEGLYEYYSEDSENRIRTDKVPHSEKTTHATQGVDQSEDDYASQTSSDGFSDSESYNNIAPRHSFCYCRITRICTLVLVIVINILMRVLSREKNVIKDSWNVFH